MLLTVFGLAIGMATAVPAQAAVAPAAPRAAKRATPPKPGDFGPDAARSADVAITGYGDAAGYHLEAGPEVQRQPERAEA